MTIPFCGFEDFVTIIWTLHFENFNIVNKFSVRVFMCHMNVICNILFQFVLYLFMLTYMYKLPFIKRKK